MNISCRAVFAAFANNRAGPQVPWAACLTAIVVGLLAALEAAHADIVYTPAAAINVFVPGNALAQTYTGTGPASDTGTYWNTPVYTANVTTSGLKNSAGTITSVSYTATGVTGNWSGNGNSNPVLNCIADANPGPMTFTFGGLTLGDEYNLYGIYMSNAQGARQFSMLAARPRPSAPTVPTQRTR